MKNEDFTTLTIDQLKAKEKSAQTAASLLAGVIIVQLFGGIYLTYVNGFNIFTIMPVVFIPILIVSFNNLKKIKQEIASRNK